MPAKTQGHILLYNQQGDYYYFTTLEDLLRKSDVQVERFETEIDSKISAMENDLQTMKRENAEFKSEMVSKYNELLESYKTTSEKLILMVEKSKETNQ